MAALRKRRGSDANVNQENAEMEQAEFDFGSTDETVKEQPNQGNQEDFQTENQNESSEQNLINNQLVELNEEQENSDKVNESDGETDKTENNSEVKVVVKKRRVVKKSDDFPKKTIENENHQASNSSETHFEHNSNKHSNPKFTRNPRQQKRPYGAKSSYPSQNTDNQENNYKLNLDDAIYTKYIEEASSIDMQVDQTSMDNRLNEIYKEKSPCN